jgi:hypothetical protein
LWLAAGSLGAVLGLAGLAAMLRLGGAPRLADGDQAIAVAQALVPGFDGAAAIVATGGDIAAVAGADGSLVLIEPMGARFRARRIVGAAVRAMVPQQGEAVAMTLDLSPHESIDLTIADPVAARAFGTALRVS